MSIHMDLSLQQQQRVIMDTEESILRPSQVFNERRKELARLATFRNWPQLIHPKLSKGLLAKQGFSYTGENDKVKCDTCLLEIDSWTPDMDPLEEHQRRNPGCPLARRQSLLFSYTALDEPSFSMVNTSHASDTEQDSNEEDPHTSNEQRQFLRTVPPKLLDQLRAKTFSNWPLITPNAQDMVLGGWWYTNIGDRVLCLHCHVMFRKWTNVDRPYDLHEEVSPSCPFVQIAKRKSIDLSKSKIQVTTKPTTQVMPEPINGAYASVTRRYETFATWPDATKASSPSIEKFVNAGFYYTGEQTVVRCFFCNGALRNWQARDDPNIEHARWYPQCAYIRQLIGEDLYEAVQQKNRALKAEQNHRTNEKHGHAQTSPWTENDIDRMVKARVDLPIVAKLRNLGYSMPILRKCIDMQLRFKKDDFESDGDLQVAYFVLEQQVKGINGNEANILIPSKWRKPPTDGSKANASLSSIAVAPVIEDTSVKTIELMQTESKTDLPESQSCLVCLSNERQIAFLPCGHLASCVTCGHGLKTCPICRAAVKGYIRIYT